MAKGLYLNLDPVNINCAAENGPKQTRHLIVDKKFTLDMIFRLIH